MVEIANDGERERTDDCSAELEHVTVEYEDAPSACTLYPRDCSEADLATHWITATEGSFVGLSEIR